MADPWDIPPFPLHGDENPDDTYRMVGPSLTSGNTSNILSRICMRKWSGNLPKMPQYAIMERP